MAEFVNLDSHGESFAEADQLLSQPARVRAGPDPVPGAPPTGEGGGSHSGHRVAERRDARGWIEYARLMAQAGADALELNLYRIATGPDTTSADIERAGDRHRAGGEGRRRRFRSP